jgi:hypothetical protein
MCKLLWQRRASGRDRVHFESRDLQIVFGSLLSRHENTCYLQGCFVYGLSIDGWGRAAVSADCLITISRNIQRRLWGVLPVSDSRGLTPALNMDFLK